jgi:hypothetical protein
VINPSVESKPFFPSGISPKNVFVIKGYSGNKPVPGVFQMKIAFSVNLVHIVL